MSSLRNSVKRREHRERSQPCAPKSPATDVLQQHLQTAPGQIDQNIRVCHEGAQTSQSWARMLPRTQPRTAMQCRHALQRPRAAPTAQGALHSGLKSYACRVARKAKGLLEKKKDYKARAADHQRKRAALNVRNPRLLACTPARLRTPLSHSCRAIHNGTGFMRHVISKHGMPCTQCIDAMHHQVVTFCARGAGAAAQGGGPQPGRVLFCNAARQDTRRRSRYQVPPAPLLQLTPQRSYAFFELCNVTLRRHMGAFPRDQMCTTLAMMCAARAGRQRQTSIARRSGR